MNNVNDGCLATGEGIIEKISQGGIEPVTSGHWSGDLITTGLQETPGEQGTHLTGLSSLHNVICMKVILLSPRAFQGNRNVEIT